MMMLGQAAGTAAALFGLDTAAYVSGDGMSRLQDQLVTDGVALDPRRMLSGCHGWH